eukprot:5032814-Lingulodinium_polyedra.AAC.1
MDRYWYALARREDIDHTFQAVHRLGGGNVSSEKIVQDYSANLKNMNKNGSGAITPGFVDT